MASIFTFETDPPRVSSPWSRPVADGSVMDSASSSEPVAVRNGGLRSQSILNGVPKLIAEPQDGPTEYKLHLLLRPRRQYTASSTGTYITGSQHSCGSASYDPDASAKVQPESASPALAPSSQSQQNRLQQLTTQLLWRLQQSLPHHCPSATSLNQPSNPSLDPRLQRGGLLPGLEESHGALYEIGVSDEGVCIGLTRDELEESLENLRVMAQSLGCAVKVLRLVVVGSCEWVEELTGDPQGLNRMRKDKLWVAEALVKPDIQSSLLGSDMRRSRTVDLLPLGTVEARVHGAATRAATRLAAPEQLRVSLMGGTTSGKSSLLGTLSSALLDNSRGRSRLCLLRHPHELASGLTSSVAHELIGYKPASAGGAAVAEVVNYASGNVSSWTDIHVSSQGGRLVFFSDSAGHPRYRRTAIRGLVGWAPHWVALCVAADGKADKWLQSNAVASISDSLSSSINMELANAHLRLCLDLDMPLVIVVTKLDIASKVGLKQILGRVLSNLKNAGRKPIIVPTRTGRGEPASLEDLQIISDDDNADIDRAITMVHEYGPRIAVPVIFTSAVQGTGIASVHALLSRLPISPPALLAAAQHSGSFGSRETPSVLFHIEVVFALPHSSAVHIAQNGPQVSHEGGAVISGHLRYGVISVGDELLLGPFPTDARTGDPKGTITNPVGESQLDGRFYNGHEAGATSSPSLPTSTMAGQQLTDISMLAEWRKMRVISIRNLRLPTSELFAGQVGSIGLVQLPVGEVRGPSHGSPSAGSSVSSPTPSSIRRRVRKGMALAHFDSPPPAFGGFVGIFHALDLTAVSEASPVVVYFASVRAAAKIVQIRDLGQCSNRVLKVIGDESIREVVNDYVDVPRPGNTAAGDTKATEVTFCFLACREWIETGIQVLVAPSRGPQGPSDSIREGPSLLDGFVGKIVRAMH